MLPLNESLGRERRQGTANSRPCCAARGGPAAAQDPARRPAGVQRQSAIVGRGERTGRGPKDGPL